MEFFCSSFLFILKIAILVLINYFYLIRKVFAEQHWTGGKIEIAILVVMMSVI